MQMDTEWSPVTDRPECSQSTVEKEELISRSLSEDSSRSFAARTSMAINPQISLPILLPGRASLMEGEIDQKWLESVIHSFHGGEIP